MDLVGYLETSMHEVRMTETDTHFYYYAIDRNQMIASNTNQAVVSCHVQLRKKLLSYEHADSYLNEIPQVSWVYTSMSYKRQNIALDMYAFIIKRHGMLWSDIKHSIGATKLWELVSSKYKVSLVDFGQDNGKIVKEWTKSSMEDKWYSKRELMLLAHSEQ